MFNTDPCLFNLQTMYYYLQLIALCYAITTVVLYMLLTLNIITPYRKFINAGSKVLFITAHPDDECMFFAPTVIRLSRKHEVHIVCLTSGNYYGKGALREKELIESCQILGLPKENVEIFDDSSFPDDRHTAWDFGKLQQRLGAYISNLQPDYILTFDENGVSDHANHIATSQVLKQMIKKKKPSQLPRVYNLESVSLLRKYTSLFDLPLSLLATNVTFVSSFSDILLSQRAMYAHKTQLVWFRVLYVIFSRYMIMNTFVPAEVSAEL